MQKEPDNQSFSIIMEFKAAQQNRVLPRQLDAAILPTWLEHSSEMNQRRLWSRMQQILTAVPAQPLTCWVILG